MRLTISTYTTGAGWSCDLPSPGDPEQTLVVAFGAPELRDAREPFADLASRYAGASVIGCSTAGEILDTAIQDGSIVVAVMQFEHTKVRVASARVHPDDSFRTGKELADALAASDLRACLVLSEGNRVNGTWLLRGINEILDPSVVTTGGLAGDGPRFERTWVLVDGEPREDLVVAAGLYGEAVRVGHGSRGGWDRFGPERRVTRSRGNVLYELDGQPALELYKRYLGELAEGLPATALLYPLAVRADEESSRALVRTILAIDEEEQSLTFAGDIPEDWRAQLMRANFDRLVDGASEAASLAEEGVLDDVAGDRLAIAISCVGRRLVLGHRAEDEVEAVVDGLPEATRVVGFYSYGEISPFARGSRCELHNQTMTLTTIAEALPCTGFSDGS